MLQPPCFIAFTGVDRPALIDDMRALSARYPIEWGILVDDAQSGKALFPNESDRAALLAAPGLRWAAHVCGEQACLIANDPAAVTQDLTGFQRVQVNHGFSGSSSTQVENAIRFGRAHGVRTMLQTLTRFPDDGRLDWLFDTSFGTGAAPKSWPGLNVNGPFCGYSGGINAGNVAGVLTAIDAPQGAQYWIDMESGVRTDGWFDLDKCEAVCRAIYG